MPNVINDESKIAINGNIVGAVFTQDRFGNENSALSFDGEGDWVTCGTDNRGISNLLTISSKNGGTPSLPDRQGLRSFSVA